MIINIIYYLNQFSFMSKIEHKNMYKRNFNNIFIRSWIKRNRSNKIIPESILTTNKKTKCENEVEMFETHRGLHAESVGLHWEKQPEKACGDRTWSNVIVSEASRAWDM